MGILTEHSRIIFIRINFYSIQPFWMLLIIYGIIVWIFMSITHLIPEYFYNGIQEPLIKKSLC